MAAVHVTYSVQEVLDFCYYYYYFFFFIKFFSQMSLMLIIHLR